MVRKVIVKEAKVNSVETNLTIKKSPTKAELMLQVKNLQQANDALEESNRKKIELLETFGGKIDNLEQQIDNLSCKETMACKETQTDAGLNLKCEECNFEGEKERELGWHMGKNHGWPSSDQKAEHMDISSDSQGVRFCEQCEYEAEDRYDLDAHESTEHTSFVPKRHKPLPCNLCEHSFNKKYELMKHKKSEHTEKVRVCWNFPLGKCSFSDETCWFHHSENTRDSYQCNLCDNKFLNQSQFLNHRKTYHEHVVPTCRNYSNGSCPYTNENCWFKHVESIHENENSENENYHENKNSENENNQENKNSENENVDKEIIQKLFKMMENFMDQITQMKEKNQLL